METAPSSSKAFVLSQIARFHMLASRNDVALRFGAEASAMADRLGLDHVRADALNTIASARAREGTEGTGIAELEESVAILERLGSVQVLRGYNNLLHLLIEHGELARGDALADRAIAEGERFGYPEWLHWLGEKRSQLWYLMGRWDDVLRLVEQELDAVEAGKPHYLECAWRAIRCLVLLPRGDRARLARESERALAAGREVGDPQMLDPAIALRARALLELGQPQRALELVDELLAALRARGGLRSVYWWHLSETAVALDRRDEVLAVAAAGGPWVEAARARARGDWGAAAGILATIGARPLEAVARRGLAEALLAEGRTAEAERELERALAFWRSVGATACLREAEELVAAVSA
jgi:tetratricopeptide (TPR) repeat protein